MSRTGRPTTRRCKLRLKTEFPPAAAILALTDDAGRLPVKVTPGARSEGVSIAEERLLIKVRAQPADGKANDAVLKLLAKALQIPTSRLRMLRGATGREKLFEISE